MSTDNDSAYLECCTPTITYMNLDQADKGARAAEWLLDMLEGKRPEFFREQIPPAGVVPLQSTAYAVPTDPGLQRALDLMESWEYELPSVDDLARTAGMSRSTLFRRMQTQLGKKPGELLYQSRREKALRLLREEDLPLSDITDRCGYGLPSQLTHDIKRHTGQSPKQYRDSWRERG
jgi:AraC-like DNA-binding protein